MSSLYPSIPDACGFHYVNIDSKPNFSPGDDINVEQTVEIETTPSVPLSILETLSTTENEDDLINKLGEISQDEVDALEQFTRGQNSNEKWKHQRFGRITASVSHRVMTKVNTLKTSTNPVDCNSLLSSLCPLSNDTNEF